VSYSPIHGIEEIRRRNREKSRSYYYRHHEKVLDEARAYREQNTEKIRAARKTWKKAPRNPERSREYSRQWRIRHLEHAREMARISAKKNFKKKLPKIVEAQNRRYESDDLFRLRRILRAGLRQALYRRKAQKGHESVTSLVGCDLAFLRDRLAAQAAPGTNWRDGKLYHVDHVRPLASFDLLDLEQRRAALHYTNLRLLPAAENLRKGARVEAASV
jgi:hypothetical protein